MDDGAVTLKPFAEVTATLSESGVHPEGRGAAVECQSGDGAGAVRRSGARGKGACGIHAEGGCGEGCGADVDAPGCDNGITRAGAAIGQGEYPRAFLDERARAGDGVCRSKIVGMIEYQSSIVDDGTGADDAGGPAVANDESARVDGGGA